jgi:ribosomal peptide maturation radical SAM protein 1
MKEPLILVNMPFGAIQFPSIQLGILQSLAQSANIPCKSIYSNIAFAQRIGPTLYNFLSNHRGVMLGEWHFSFAAFDTSVKDADDFMSRFADAFTELERKTGVPARRLKHLREVTAPKFIQETADRIVAAGPKVVGLTSTFEQNLASIALARAIKARDPGITTLFGGANFDGTMGVAYMEAIPWIDVCVVGEADHIFVPLVTALIEGREPPDMKGVLTRDRLADSEAVGRAFYNAPMDDLPVPLYDDYFDALADHQMTDEDLGRSIVLPFESSRGCWWGEKHHCTFCGLNAMGMGFRSKSAGKVVGEIATLTERHNINRFAAVDNILSPKLFDGLEQELAEGQYDYDLFYEIKANLARDKIRRMHNSGIRRVQPGIESLSSHVLKLMKKGITAIQNVNALRWMNFYGLEVLWNILYGFPGETEADYDRQLQIVRLICHLAPPNYVGRIWLERFSPLYSQSETFGFAGVKPEPSYEYIYPTTVDLARASYFFRGSAPDTVSDDYMDATRAEVDTWKAKWSADRPPFLTFVKTHGGIHISDGRDDPSSPLLISYRAPADLIYQYCSDQPRSLDGVGQFLRETHEIMIDRGDLESILNRFVSRGFMLAEDGLYLTLALPSYRPA